MRSAVATEVGPGRAKQGSSPTRVPLCASVRTQRSPLETVCFRALYGLDYGPGRTIAYKRQDMKVA